METRARELSRKSLETFVLRSIGQVAMTITGIVIARALGPSGKGSYAYALTILTLLLTLSSGQSAAISRQYGRRRMPSSDVYAAMLRLMFLVAVPLSLIVAAAGWFRHDLAMAAAGLVLP
ncbi:MAG: hypothetical protein M3R35_04295, partial [Candidatus Eremiobacteraeota bacterium]|nr:hypothetical protein [Candidatus Eremiobacteraeota bacterium]